MVRKGLRWLVVWLVMVSMAVTPAMAQSEALKRGSTGSDVKAVQSRLKQWGYYSGPVDGIYGSATEAAVRKFQQRNGLTVDGKVGSQTAKAIGITLSGSKYTSSGSTGGYSSAEINLLAHVVHAEARGEPYTGMVAVAAVVLNRVKSPQFPNTISGVVYQKNAFSSVNDGSINLTPSAQAMRAAKDAISGWDPSGGALYFYNPATSTSSWIFSRKVITTIGRHRFAV